MLRHLRSLRRMDRDHGWIHTLLEEAENERMHLLTFLKLRQPGPIFRLSVILTQVKQRWMHTSLSSVESVSMLLAGPGYESVFHNIHRAPAALPPVSCLHEHQSTIAQSPIVRRVWAQVCRIRRGGGGQHVHRHHGRHRQRSNRSRGHRCVRASTPSQ